MPTSRIGPIGSIGKLMQGIGVEPEIHALRRHLLDREIDISILEMPEPGSIAQRVEELDDSAIVHDRELARMRKEQLRQELLESGEIVIDLLLM